MAKKILIVEDEEKLSSLLSDYLVQASFETHIIDNGLDVLPWLNNNECDLIILDLMLPGKDGLTVCREIRPNFTMPIIMATAKVEEIDRLIGLESGADDYVCKPFSYRELVARVQAIFRRQERYQNHALQNPSDSLDSSEPDSYAPKLRLDKDKYRAELNGKALDLTAVEFNLLNALAEHPGRIFNREQLMSLIYPEYRVVSDRTIDSHVKKVRQKIRQFAPGEEYIHSVYSVGYKFQYP